jgi:hypothetical protein
LRGNPRPLAEKKTTILKDKQTRNAVRAEIGVWSRRACSTASDKVYVEMYGCPGNQKWQQQTVADMARRRRRPARRDARPGVSGGPDTEFTRFAAQPDERAVGEMLAPPARAGSPRMRART